MNVLNYTKSNKVCLFLLLFLFSNGFSEKILIYDEEKGIIFIDKDSKEQKKDLGKKTPEDAKEKKKDSKKTSLEGLSKQFIDTSLIAGRKKEPPEAYFKAGLQFFKAGNYTEALKLFLYADSLDPQPVYSLWIGKSYRQLGKREQHLFLMNKILKIYPESDVADDALFEIAFSYQKSDDYENAIKYYTMLMEQYPFGTSYSNGESFRDVAKKQKQIMRSEMISTLKILGYKGTELEDLYSDFQKANNLPVTGIGDIKTVSLIKQEYKNYIKKEEQKFIKQKKVKKYLNISFFLIAFNLLIIFCMILIRFKITSMKKHLEVLSQTLADLDLKKL
jgi:tetratricopeptide (TPR) repeat protein